MEAFTDRWKSRMCNPETPDPPYATNEKDAGRDVLGHDLKFGRGHASNRIGEGREPD